MRNTVILPFPTAVLILASVCNGFLGNLGRNKPVRPKSTHHDDASSFGDVNLPLGAAEDFSGNIWTQGTIDPQMYTRYSQPSSHGNDYQASYGGGGGGYQLPDQEQGSPASQRGYDLPPTPASAGYELPPSLFDPCDYPDFYNQAGSTTPADAHSYQPPMSPAMSYQSFGQPYIAHRDYSLSGQEDEYPQELDTTDGMWSLADSAGELPYATPSVNMNMPDHTQAMDRLSLGLRRVATGGSSDEGGSSRRAGTSRRKGKAIAEGSSRVREPQTARLASRRRERAIEQKPQRQPTTSRALTSKEQEQLIVKSIVEREFRTRNLNSDMHQQVVAQHLCEIKITHPGYERAIGNSAAHIVERWNNGPEYVYDFQGWTVIYRNKVTMLRRKLEKSGMALTPPEIMQYLLAHFRDVPTNFHGTLADPAEEQAELQQANEVWAQFWEARLEGVIQSEDEVTMAIVAERCRGFKAAKKTIHESMTLIKKYLRTFLDFKYYDINELDVMLKLAAEQ